MTDLITAAVLVIGDEILSGRTKDKNIGFIADYCTGLGIDLKEVRIVPDDEADIIAALNALRARFSYVFTTGGIGPTHDDITADCVAKAFGVDLPVNEEARQILLARYGDPALLNEARLRMARIPVGASIIDNVVSGAPGFMIGNVIVMAGIPAVMQAMMDAVARRLKTGVRMSQVSIEARGLKEGDIGTAYGEIAKAYPSVVMGSYPLMDDKGFSTRLVLRSRDVAALAAAEKDVIMLANAHKPVGTELVIIR